MEAFRALPLEERKSMADRVRDQHPGKVPIVCDRAQTCKDDIGRPKNVKFLTPSTLTVAAFQRVLRRQMHNRDSSDSSDDEEDKVQPHLQAIYLYCGQNGCLCPASSTLGSMHEKYAEEDGFLYISYTGENTFG